MSQDLNDYGGPDPVGGLFDRLKLWADQNPVKAEGGVVCAALGGAWLAFPGPMWSMATTYLFRFGLAHVIGLAIWCIRFEVREQRLQRWLLQPGHGFHWILDHLRWLDPDAIEPVGHWEAIEDKPEPVQTAEEALDEMLQEVPSWAH